MFRLKLVFIALVTTLICACASVPPTGSGLDGASAPRAMPGMNAPGNSASGGSGAPGLSVAEKASFKANGPFPVDLRSIPAGVYDPNNQRDRRGNAGRIESPIPDELVELLREEAMLLPPARDIQQAYQESIDQLAIEKLGPSVGVKFDSLDYNDCCGGGGNVPPDSELAVGPDHIIAVVNVAFEIYDKSGSLLAGPTTFSSFFAGTPGCSNTGVFDPNVIYDEEYDRFILGIDGNGTDYCVAATTGPNPTGGWNRYGFSTGSGFFDYPHAGVGLDAIYMGANIFSGQSYIGSRVWAMDKLDMYSGAPLSVVQRSTGGESTPQPMNLHGFNQGSWPLSGPHYILTDDQFNGSTYGVWSWEDPFGADVFTDEGTVNLAAAIPGVSVGMPVDVPQMGGGDLQGNDFRVQDAEYRNGDIWMSGTVACNPGGGTVNCVRWAQIDPTGPIVVNAGVLASSGEYRTFADLAVNHCDDMAVGYTKSSSSMHPSVFVSGRENSDAYGSLQAETLVMAGEKTYTPFDSAPHRWGDYSGMTIDPDGQTFWYLGEYSKGISGTNWGNYIGSFSFPDCTVTVAPPDEAGNPNPGNGDVGVSPDVILSWTKGVGATSHDVYFGGAFQGSQNGTSFDPGTLAESTTYNWRIDEVNSGYITTGPLWSFTTGSIPAFHVANISVATRQINGKRARGVATVTVTDESESGVGGVAISGTFSGDWNGTRSGTTDSSGKLVLETSTVRNGSSWDFCVNSAGKSGWVHDEEATANWLCLYVPPATEGTIVGKVTDASNTNAISGVIVSVDTGQSDTTDGSGNYELTAVQTGSRTVSVSATGYDPASKQTTVSDGATSTLDFALDKTVTGGGTGTLKGNVTTSSGGKARGALVEVAGLSATTNKRGKYTISGVPEGSQTVTATLGSSSGSGTVTIVTGTTSNLDIRLNP